MQEGGRCDAPAGSPESRGDATTADPPIGDAEMRQRARYPGPAPPLHRTRVAVPAGLAGLLIATASFRSAQNMAQTTLALLARQDFGLSDAAIGAIGALWGLLGVTVTVLVARRVPTGRARRGAAIGIGLLVIALVNFALAHSLVLLVTAVVVMGAAGGLANSPKPAGGLSADPLARLEAMQPRAPDPGVDYQRSTKTIVSSV
jgi:predicted MFS family arabinose efflux permease